MAFAQVSSSCGGAFGVRNVTFAAEGQQQRMHSRGIDGVDRMNARYDRRNERAGQFVNRRRSSYLPAAGDRRR